MLSEVGKKAKQIDVRKLASDVLNENSGLITKKVIQQLTVGESGKGQDIGKYTSQRYASLKRRMGSQAPAGVVDLKFSGDLYKGLDTTFKGFTIDTDSSVSYSKYQKKRYGKKIYDLQKENTKDTEYELSQKIIETYFGKLDVSV
jgi:hypothetical protein